MTKLIKHLPLAALVAATLAAGTAFAVEGGPAAAGRMMKPDMTRAEAQAKASEMFTRLDANRDGKLDQVDLQARMTQRFAAVDTDNNGQISREEFGARQERGHDRDHGRMEGQMDGRGAGRHAGHGGHGGPGGGMMRMARMADTNQDNAISQTEFMTAAMQQFDRADTDKNGKISATERRAAKAAMRAQMGARVPPTPAAN